MEIAFPNVYHLCQHIKDCFPALFYIIWTSVTESNLIAINKFWDSLYSMVLYSHRKLLKNGSICYRLTNLKCIL